VNVTTVNVTVMTDSREYVLSVPKTYDSGRQYPLIVALAGDGQDAAGFRVFLGLDDISGDDAIMAYPDQVYDLFTAYAQNEDQQLVEVVISDVKSKYSIDASKVWALGYSKGGFIANEIACRKPGLLKAMANHAAGAPSEPTGTNGYPTCPGVVALPVLQTQGDSDGEIGADYAASYWALVDGCGTTRTPTAPTGCQLVDGCPAKDPVMFCDVAGVSHFPIWSDAAQVSWDFLKGL
jgi:polyhydroxybutyrate depolymerase